MKPPPARSEMDRSFEGLRKIWGRMWEKRRTKNKNGGFEENAEGAREEDVLPSINFPSY